MQITKTVILSIRYWATEVSQSTTFWPSKYKNYQSVRTEPIRYMYSKSRISIVFDNQVHKEPKVIRQNKLNMYLKSGTIFLRWICSNLMHDSWLTIIVLKDVSISIYTPSKPGKIRFKIWISYVQVVVKIVFPVKMCFAIPLFSLLHL